MPTPAVRDKLLTLGGLLAVGGGYAAWARLPAEQALNGFISVLMFNIVYDLLLRWAVLPICTACVCSLCLGLVDSLCVPVWPLPLGRPPPPAWPLRQRSSPRSGACCPPAGPPAGRCCLDPRPPPIPPPAPPSLPCHCTQCSKKLKWYALCPLVDAMNHSSLVEVRRR